MEYAIVKIARDEYIAEDFGGEVPACCVGIVDVPTYQGVYPGSVQDLRALRREEAIEQYRSGNYIAIN